MPTKKKLVKKTSKQAPPKKATKKSPKKAVKKKPATTPKRVQPPVDTPLTAEKPNRDELPAYKAYKRALTFIHKKQYAKAKEHLTKIIVNFPEEIEVLARAHSFLKICEKQLERTTKTVSDPEVIFNQGVLYHNTGQYERALDHYNRALSLSKQSKDHIYYAIAATELAIGKTETARQYLEQAIQINPENQFFALHDPDFQALLTDKESQELLQPK